MKPELSSEQHFLTIGHLFISYARMISDASAFPKTQAHWEKRYRIISGLFEVEIDDDPFREIAEGYNRAGIYTPLPKYYLGNQESVAKSAYWKIRPRLLRNCVALRRSYIAVATDIVEAMNPHVIMKRVSVRRLREFEDLELPLIGDKSGANLVETETEANINDDVPKAVIDGLKRAEERRERNRILVSHAKGVIIERALKLGLASRETVNERIYNMEVQDFLRLAHDYPVLSRVDFNSCGS